ncbi:MAG: hypothetical protein J5643_03060 [Lachnospiraceae bacterium]|nr:hypothetical protein [Lachnospiraceae bacterium]
MRAEEQLKQSMQQMHLSTEAKNRILSDVLEKASEPKAAKRPFYCSAVFKSLSASAAVILAVILIVSGAAVFKDGLLSKTKSESDFDQAPIQQLSEESEQVAYVIPIRGEKSKGIIDFSPVTDNPNDTTIAANLGPGEKTETAKRSDGSEMYSFRIQDYPGLVLSKDANSESNSSDSAVSLMKLYGTLEEYLSGDYPSGKCYILSVSRSGLTYRVEIRLTEEPGLNIRTTVDLKDVPQEGTDYVVTLERDENEVSFRVIDISKKD